MILPTFLPESVVPYLIISRIAIIGRLIDKAEHQVIIKRFMEKWDMYDTPMRECKITS